MGIVGSAVAREHTATRRYTGFEPVSHNVFKLLKKISGYVQMSVTRRLPQPRCLRSTVPEFSTVNSNSREPNKKVDSARRSVYSLEEAGMKRNETKQRIIENGARLIHLNGYHNTGIKEVLDAAQVPKGSFYFYFKNKEDFGLAVVDFFRNQFADLGRSHLKNRSKKPLARLQDLFEDSRNYFKLLGCRLGCPIGNLATEMGDVNDAFRDKLEGVFEEMRAGIEAFLIAAQEVGELDDGMDTRECAEFILDSWEGALLRMKAQGTVEPLARFERMIFKLLGKYQPQ